MRSWQGVAALAGLAVLAQLYGVYRPTGPPSPSWLPDADKVEHAVGFGLPVGLILRAITLRAREQRARASRRVVLGVVGLFLAHAVVSEVIQHYFYRHRTGDPRDVLADWVGVGLGVLGHWLLVTRHTDRDRARARL